MPLTFAQPQRIATDFGKRRTWSAGAYRITQEGQFPFVCWRRIEYHDTLSDRVDIFYKPFDERRTLKAAMKVCQRRAKGEA